MKSGRRTLKEKFGDPVLFSRCQPEKEGRVNVGIPIFQEDQLYLSRGGACFPVICEVQYRNISKQPERSYRGVMRHLDTWDVKQFPRPSDDVG